MSTNNIDFYEEIAKIIFQLSSNMHFICSSVNLQLDVSVTNYGQAESLCLHGYKLFFMLNSDQHEIYPAQKLLKCQQYRDQTCFSVH